jgi:hypothetical protein
MNLADGVTTSAAGFDKKSDQQLHAILENLGRVANQNDLHSGLTRLEMDALERKAIYDRLVAIENQMKRRGGSGGFARYLVGILIGVAATLAWQSWTKTAGRSREQCCSTVRVGNAASGDGCADCFGDRRLESARRALPRPGANAAANAQSDHPAANRRATCRRSRRDETCNRQSGVRCGGSTCEVASASAAPAPRCPRAQADADRAAVFASPIAATARGATDRGGYRQAT